MLLRAGPQVMHPEASEQMCAAWSSEKTGSPEASLRGGGHSCISGRCSCTVPPNAQTNLCQAHERNKLAGWGWLQYGFPRQTALSHCSVPTRHILHDLNWDFKLFSQNFATHTRSDAADKLRDQSTLCRQQGMVMLALHNKVITATSCFVIAGCSTQTHVFGHFCSICTATRPLMLSCKEQLYYKRKEPTS